MSIDHCLLLSAGFGTRMGDEGKNLPKVLWPIFNKTLIELEIAFAKSLGCRDIYINSHFLHDQLKDFIENLNDDEVTLLHEEELLGSGGAIHNCVKKIGKDKGRTLLTINADQFFFFDKDYFEEGLKNIENSHAVFFGLQVDEAAHYNKFVMEGECNILRDIIPNDKKSGNYFTYSGMGLINLEKLALKEGKSDFFETVANYKRDRVSVVVPDNAEYWDFGTLDLYRQKILDLESLTDKSSLFASFCREQSIDKEDSEFRQFWKKIKK